MGRQPQAAHASGAGTARGIVHTNFRKTAASCNHSSRFPFPIGFIFGPDLMSPRPGSLLGCAPSPGIRRALARLKVALPSRTAQPRRINVYVELSERNKR